LFIWVFYQVIHFHSCHEVFPCFGEQEENAEGGLDSSIAVPHKARQNEQPLLGHAGP